MTAGGFGTARAARPFAGRSAFVTGASSGLGAHFARLLADGGAARLFLAARRVDRLATVAEACREAGAAEVVPVRLDVTDEASVEAAFALAAEQGGVDLLINNAGVADTRPALDVGGAELDAVLGANLRGAWLCARQAAMAMKAAGTGGDIVNIASILGVRVANSVSAYAVSKAAILQMTRAFAIEWARFGIRVNALAPGYVATELNGDFFATAAGQSLIGRIPMRRLGEMADLDAPFTLLASGASPYLTGATLIVDGGHSINSL